MAKALAILSTLAVVGGTSARADPWDDALARVSYRSPTDFPQLPMALARELVSRGCRIPQPWGRPSTANVVAGHFARAGQSDYAVLCSRERESTIVVFWGGPARCPSELAPAADRGYLQIVHDDEAGFSREISTVDVHYIQEHGERYGGPVPQGPPKDGIDDAFVGKASIVHYCVDGLWTELQGAD